MIEFVPLRVLVYLYKQTVFNVVLDFLIDDNMNRTDFSN